MRLIIIELKSKLNSVDEICIFIYKMIKSASKFLENENFPQKKLLCSRRIEVFHKKKWNVKKDKNVISFEKRIFSLKKSYNTWLLMEVKVKPIAYTNGVFKKISIYISVW